MEYWLRPHISKIYEAYTAIADGHIQFINGNLAHCDSTSGNKFYEITFNLESLSMMSNDNTAFFTDKLSYPMIAVLMLKGVIKYNVESAKLFKGILWKDINQKNKNDYDKSVEEVLNELKEKQIDTDKIISEVGGIYKDICTLKIAKLGPKKFPPNKY